MRVSIQFYIDPGGTTAQSTARNAGPDWQPIDCTPVI